MRAGSLRQPPSRACYGSALLRGGSHLIGLPENSGEEFTELLGNFLHGYGQDQCLLSRNVVRLLRVVLKEAFAREKFEGDANSLKARSLDLASELALPRTQVLEFVPKELGVCAKISECINKCTFGNPRL